MESNLSLPSFWPRVWACVIDIIILGVLGFILGIIWQDFFASLGANARLIGWAIALAYFGILNSKVNNGQTLGKRVLNIQVTDIHGNTISLATSFLRAFIFTMPFFLNGFRLTGKTIVPMVDYIQLTIIFVLGTGITVFYIFNNANRQSIHDIIAKTYVVREYREEFETYIPAFKKLPLYILTGMLCVFLPLSFYISRSTPESKKLNHVYQEILQLDNIASAGVFKAFQPLTDSTGTKRFVYTVSIKTTKVYSGNPGDGRLQIPQLENSVATFLKSQVYDNDNDILNVAVSSGFDIGIASKTKSFNIAAPIAAWKEMYRL